MNFFFSVLGYVLSFLDRVIVKSLKSTSTSHESSVELCQIFIFPKNFPSFLNIIGIFGAWARKQKFEGNVTEFHSAKKRERVLFRAQNILQGSTTQI